MTIFSLLAPLAMLLLGPPVPPHYPSTLPAVERPGFVAPVGHWDGPRGNFVRVR